MADAPAAAACPASSASPPLPPLFERVGGMTALVNAVDVFYSRILDDPTLAPFFEGVEMSRQRTKQVNGERGRGVFFVFRPPALGLLTLESAKKIIKNVSTLPGPVPLLRLRRPGPVPRQVDRRGPRAPHPRARRPPGALLDRGPALERVARAAAGPGGADRGVHRQHRPGGVGVPGARGRAGAWTGARPRGGDSGSGELESLGDFTFFSFSPPPPLFCSGFGSGVFESGTREQKKSSLFWYPSFSCSTASKNRSSRSRGQKGALPLPLPRRAPPLRTPPRRRRSGSKGSDRTSPATEPRARPFFSCSTLPSSPPPRIDSLGRFSRSPPSLPRPPVPSPPRPPRTKYSSSPASLLSLIIESTIVEARLKQRESCLSKLKL